MHFGEEYYRAREGGKLMQNIESGFTLIEIMIALLLISVASLATAKLAGSVVGSSHTNEARMNTAAIANSIINAEVARISVGGPVSAPAANMQYIAGDSDIMYDLFTQVAPPAGVGMPQEVFIRVTVHHPALPQSSFSTQTVVMTVQ